MLLLSENDIQQVVSMRDMIDAVGQAFSMLAAGKIDSPLRTVIQNGAEGSFLTMPTFSVGMGACVKIINVFPANVQRDLNTIHAEVLLMDGETGQFLALMDGSCVTKLRTGAASGAAIEQLARKDCRKGALFGSGVQAETQLAAMLTVRELEEVSIFSPHREHLLSFAEKMRAAHPEFRGRLLPAETAADCVADADIVITVTSSESPVFDSRLLKPGALVSGVGTYEPHKHELDSALMARASRIYCDSVEAALSETGDLLIPIREGLLRREDITGSLGELINGRIPGRENDEEIIVFETVGVAAQDLAAARLIYDRAIAAGVGIDWE